MIEQTAGCRIKVEALDEGLSGPGRAMGRVAQFVAGRTGRRVRLAIERPGFAAAAKAQMRRARCGSTLPKVARPTAVCLAAARGR